VLGKASSSTGNPLKWIDPDGREAIFFIVGPSYKEAKSSFGHAAALATSGRQRASKSEGTVTQLTPRVSSFVNQYLSEGRTVTAVILTPNSTRDARLVQAMQAPPKLYGEPEPK
jgi:hypothetical protein